MTKAQKFVPIVVILVTLLAVGYSLLPFKFADRVDCGPPLFGSDPKSNQSVGFIIPEIDCREKGRSRLATSAIVALIAAIGGTAAIALKPQSPQCLGGNHDGCPEWWGNLMGRGAGFGCQCECHSDMF